MTHVWSKRYALAVTSPVEVAPGVTRPRPGVEVRRVTRHGHESRECLLRERLINSDAPIGHIVTAKIPRYNTEPVEG